MFRKVDTSKFATSPTAKKYPFSAMKVGDCWDVPEGSNVASIRTQCCLRNKMNGIQLVVRCDQETHGFVVVRIA